MKEEFHKKEVEQSSVKKKVSEVQCQTKRDVQWILKHLFPLKFEDSFSNYP